MPRLLEILIVAALVVGLIVLVMLLANEKTRLVTIVLLALLVPGVLVVGGGLFLLFWAEPVRYEVQPAPPASVGLDRPAESGLPQPGTAAENLETRSAVTADTADENAAGAEPEADIGAESSRATVGNASDEGNS